MSTITTDDAGRVVIVVCPERRRSFLRRSAQTHKRAVSSGHASPAETDPSSTGSRSCAPIARCRCPRFKEIARGYDCVFLDGPPRLGDVTRSAAVAADVALLPIQPGPFDFWAVAETLESLKRRTGRFFATDTTSRPSEPACPSIPPSTTRDGS